MTPVRLICLTLILHSGWTWTRVSGTGNEPWRRLFSTQYPLHAFSWLSRDKFVCINGQDRMLLNVVKEKWEITDTPRWKRKYTDEGFAYFVAQCKELCEKERKGHRHGKRAAGQAPTRRPDKAFVPIPFPATAHDGDWARNPYEDPVIDMTSTAHQSQTLQARLGSAANALEH